MKSIATKFILFSTVVVFALSGIQSDRTIISGAQASDAQNEVATIDFSEEASKEVERRKHSQNDDPTFAFPNVFDVFRFIF